MVAVVGSLTDGLAVQQADGLRRSRVARWLLVVRRPAARGWLEAIPFSVVVQVKGWQLSGRLRADGSLSGSSHGVLGQRPSKAGSLFRSLLRSSSGPICPAPACPLSSSLFLPPASRGHAPSRPLSAELLSTGDPDGAATSTRRDPSRSIPRRHRPARPRCGSLHSLIFFFSRFVSQFCPVLDDHETQHFHLHALVLMFDRYARSRDTALTPCPQCLIVMLRTTKAHS